MDRELALAVLGFADLQKQDALLGAIQNMPAEQRKAAMTAIAAPKSIIPSGIGASMRDEALRRIDGLPAGIVGGLVAKRLALGDAVWYVTKAVGGATTVNMFSGSDTITPGLANISQEKLEKDYYFLPIHAQFLSGVNASPLAASYDGIPAAIANGTFEWRAQDKPVFPKDSAMQMFANDNETFQPKGSWRISNPKWFEPQARMALRVDFSAAAAANTNLKFLMYGCGVQPY